MLAYLVSGGECRTRPSVSVGDPETVSRIARPEGKGTGGSKWTLLTAVDLVNQPALIWMREITSQTLGFVRRLLPR
jgi:hypothetical protein